MTTKSNQSIGKRALMFCGSVLVAGTAIVSFSNEVSARDRRTSIKDHSHAKIVCPNLCKQRSAEERYPESGWYPHKWTGHWTHTAGSSQNPYAAVCGCGEWRFTKKGAKFKELEPAEQSNFDEWKDLIANRGFNPKDAAKGFDSQYKKLYSFMRDGKKLDMYQIRLGGKNRATFIVDKDEFMVTVDQVGGHTK